MSAAPASPFTLAVCAEMVHTELPLPERIRRIGEHGLAAEIWDWSRPDVDLDQIAATGVLVLSMTGGLRGDLSTDDGVAALLTAARESVDAAQRLAHPQAGPPRLNLHGTALDDRGLPVRPVTAVTGAMWARAALTLEQVATLGEEHGVVFELENLNLAVDHPGTPFHSPADTRALVATVDSPHLRMNLDLYHAQIGHGDLIATCRDSLPWIGEVQVADVPGRAEPGTGEIAYRAVARALHAMGYTGIVAMEAWASGDSDAAIETFARTFSEI